MAEPEWMQKITNATVCNFFYAWFVVYAVFFVLSLIALISVFFSAKKLGSALAPIAIQSTLTMLIAASFMMFYYIICNRALLPLMNAKPHEPFMGNKNRY
jgi:hypothetical protein